MSVIKALAARWRTEYGSRRYLREAHDEVLKRRRESLVANIWTAPGDGLPVPVEKPWRTALLERLSHVAEETTRRNVARDLPDTLEALVEEATATYMPVDALKGRRLRSSPYLVRFSKSDALDHGRFRIATAAIYKDSSLNTAQKDDEPSHFVVTPDKALKMKMYGFAAHATHERQLPVVTEQLFEYSNTGNFYVLCLTDRYDARMFHDFDADAAIIITNPRVFLRRIEKMMRGIATTIRI